VDTGRLRGGGCLRVVVFIVGGTVVVESGVASSTVVEALDVVEDRGRCCCSAAPVS
jgi:hypothetical protein